MYPFSVDRNYVRDSWYVAALSSEVSDNPVDRRILGDLVLLYRDSNGDPVALSGLCPHRRLPLRLGKRVGDNVQCGYHGITFDTGGNCVSVPTQEKPSERLSLHKYPVAERWKWIWIWTGDPADADPNLIPDHREMGLEGDWEATPPEYYHVAARSQMLIENLLDLSHISFLHGDYIEDAAWYETPVTIERDGDRCVASRHTPSSRSSDFHRWMFPDAPELVGQDLRTVFLGPALTYSGPVVREAAANGSNGRYLGTMYAAHAITPETPRSSHYFSTTTRDFRTGDAAMSEELHTMDIAVRNQDLVALAAIEAELHREDSLPPEVSVKADNPALYVRRMIEDRLRAQPA